MKGGSIMEEVKIKFGEDKRDQEIVYSKAIKAGKKGGDCYIFCANGSGWGISDTCADGYDMCGDSGWMCAKWDGSRCD